MYTRKKLTLFFPQQYSSFRGFDHDCTLQEMVNAIKHKSCIKQQQTCDANISPMVVESSIPICGNGVIEPGEECDCGLRRYCKKWNCRPHNCTAVIKFWHLVNSYSYSSFIFQQFCNLFKTIQSGKDVLWIPLNTLGYFVWSCVLILAGFSNFF